MIYGPLAYSRLIYHKPKGILSRILSASDWPRDLSVCLSLSLHLCLSISPSLYLCICVCLFASFHLGCKWLQTCKSFASAWPFILARTEGQRRLDCRHARVLFTFLVTVFGQMKTLFFFCPHYHFVSRPAGLGTASLALAWGLAVGLGLGRALALAVCLPSVFLSHSLLLSISLFLCLSLSLWVWL